MAEHCWKLYIGQAVGGNLDLTVLTAETEEQAAIQFGDEHVVQVMKRSFGDHVNQERIFGDYVDRRDGDSLTTKFGVLHHLFSKKPSHYILTLKTTAVFAKMVDNLNIRCGLTPIAKAVQSITYDMIKQHLYLYLSG
jgi:hypothetical protein